MEFLTFCIFIGLICIGISFQCASKKKKEFDNTFYKAKVLYSIENNGMYEIHLEMLEKESSNEVILTTNVNLPVNTIVDLTIINDNATIYFNRINQNEVFKVLNKAEKWKYSGLGIILIGICEFIFSQNGYTPSLIGLLCTISAVAFLLIYHKSQVAMRNYEQQEENNELVNVIGTVIKTIKNECLIEYNIDDITNVVVCNKNKIKSDALNLVYSYRNKETAIFNKKKIKIIKIISLILTVVCVMFSLAMFLCFK